MVAIWEERERMGEGKDRETGRNRRFVIPGSLKCRTLGSAIIF